MRVATEATPHAQTATVGVWIDAGSRYETAANNGTAHFLEHMAFKGTKTRTTAGLEEEIENMGAHLNAYTSREQTTYYAKVFKQDVPKAVDVLSDILQNSSLEPAHVERERGVILREMEEVEKEVEEVLFDHLHATAFQQTGLGRTILGSAENVRTITRENLSAYIGTHYTAPRMVLVGSGAVDHDELVKLATNAFGGLSTAGASVEELITADPAHFTGSDVRIRDDDMPTVSFCVAFKGASWKSPDAVPLMVMQAMLGSFDSSFPSAINSGSRMVSILAGYNERQYPLVQSAMTFNTQYSDTGLFGVYYVTDLANIMEAQWAVMREFQELCHNASDEAVEIAKAQLKATIVGQLDASLSQVTEDIGRQLLNYGRRMHMAEMMARIDAVDAPTVRRVATSLFNDKCIAMSAKGNISAIPDYGWLRRHTWSLRY